MLLCDLLNTIVLHIINKGASTPNFFDQLGLQFEDETRKNQRSDISERCLYIYKKKDGNYEKSSLRLEPGIQDPILKITLLKPVPAENTLVTYLDMSMPVKKDGSEMKFVATIHKQLEKWLFLNGNKVERQSGSTHPTSQKWGKRFRKSY